MNTNKDSMSQSFKFRNSFNQILASFNQTKNLNLTSEHELANTTNDLIQIIDKLQNLLLLFSSNKSQEPNFRFANPINDASQHDSVRNKEEIEFLQQNNEQTNEIIVYIGSLLNNLIQSHPILFKDEQKSGVYLKYSQLVISLAEKSPLVYRADTTNKLVSFFIEWSLNAIKNGEQNAIKNIAYELYRALGSLIYQNGPNLSESILRSLFGNDQKPNNGLLFMIRDQIEIDITKAKEYLAQRDENEQVWLTNKISLILTQLIFNLTMPVITQTQTNKIDSNNSTGSQSASFIADKHKKQCAYLVVRLIRYHTQADNSIVSCLPTSNQLESEEQKDHLTRLLTKALQALENLFSSLQKEPTQNSWLNSLSTDYQLGDILAIVKGLSFYGIQKTSNLPADKYGTHKLNPKSENKLEPSNVDILLSADKSKKPNDELAYEDTEESNSINYGNYANKQNRIADNGGDDTTKSKNSKQNNYFKSTNRTSDSLDKSWGKQQQQNDSKYNNKNKRYTKYSSGPNSNNKQSNQSQQQNEQLPFANINSNEAIISTNSIQCLREANVPLIQYKNTFNSNEIRNATPSDSEMSADSAFASTTSSFYIEKCNAKVRIASIGVLLTAFQVLDKKTMLSYWDSFLGTNNHSSNLIWSVRNDYSPKVRLIASTALSVYLESARAFFTIAAADDSQTNQSSNLNFQQTSSFLPISHTIATLIKQLHRDLLNSLCKRETFTLNQIQLLKCLKSLIRATPYQKLKPGLIFKLITNLMSLLNQKSSLNNLNSAPKAFNSALVVEILNCFQQILANHHELAEVHLALVSPISPQHKARLDPSETLNDDSNLSSKLEQLGNLKVAPVNQSRVTYFYEGNNSFSYKSSLNASNSVSGFMTPSYLANETFSDNNEANKCWLVTYCIQNLKLNSLSNQANVQISSACLELMLIMCKKYFDLLRRDLFFDQITQFILDNIDFVPNQNLNDLNLIDGYKLKTLKFLEEFARCLATNELRAMNNIDLNDCSKFWSQLLNSKLVNELLCDEQRYMISSMACDCLASIGASIFELLPFQKRIYCLTNLLHLTKSQSNLIRSSSVRALGVYITFTSLKEDQTFINDLSQCLHELLNDSNNLVRQKTAWSLSNLSEVLVENGDKLGKIFTDEFNLKTWQKLLDIASSLCSRESDKLKSYLVRALGNLINYITLIDHELIKTEFKDIGLVERSITRAVEALCSCRHVKMLKVKWNLSHAIGVAMRQFNTFALQINNPKWLQIFYDTLVELFTQSSNFKVRINACIALMTINLNRNEKSSNSSEIIYLKLWNSLIDTFTKLNNENMNSDDATNELQHKLTLIHQLCKLFTYLCKYLRIYDLEDLMKNCINPLKMNSISISNRLGAKADQVMPSNSLTMAQLRAHLVSYIQKIFEQFEANKQEVQFYTEALNQLQILNTHTKSSLDEDCIRHLNSLLKKQVDGNLEESESSETEHINTDNENELDDKNAEISNRKKFPFKQTYD